MSDWTDNNTALWISNRHNDTTMTTQTEDKTMSDQNINNPDQPLATLGQIAERDDCELSYPSLVTHRHDEDFPREVRGKGGPGDPRVYRPEEVVTWVDRYLDANPGAKRMSRVSKGPRKARSVSSAPDFTDLEKALEHIIKAAEKEIVGLQKRIDVLDENVSRASATLGALRGESGRGS